MRRRATIIPNTSTSPDLADLKLEERTLLHPDVNGAREERFTYSLDELPTHLSQELEQAHKLHIRWTSGSFYQAAGPYVSRATSGLHVYYTPVQKQSENQLCQKLKLLFSDQLKCNSTQSTFTQPSLISERFTASTSLQYYSPLQDLTQLISFIQQQICSPGDLECIRSATLLTQADYLDFDYESISHTLVMTTFWSDFPQTTVDKATRAVMLNGVPIKTESKANDKVEVGYLTKGKTTDPHEIQVSGLLANVGQDEAPKPVMFSFASRHHSLPAQTQSYTISFDQPTGLHPTLNIQFPSLKALNEPTSKPDGSTCALHAHFTLPSAIFADQYAFPTTVADPVFEAANHIKYLRSISGELDLEAPNYITRQWGSTMLLELSTPKDNPIEPHKTVWTVSVPLHLRYLPPSNKSHIPTDIPWPVVFWACTAEEGTKFPNNPFDRIHLGYDTLFGPRTMFYHLRPASSSSTDKVPGMLYETIYIPVLNTSSVGGNRVVQWGTLVVVVLGFAWIMAKLWPAFALGPGSRGGSRAGSDTKKKQ